MSMSIIVVLCFKFILSQNVTRWKAKDLARYANENYKPKEYGVFDPEHLIKEDSPILSEMDMMGFAVKVNSFLFIVNSIDCDTNDDKNLKEYTSELSRYFNTLSTVKEEDTLILLYSVKQIYLAFHFGVNVDLTKGNVLDINLQYLVDLFKGDYKIFKDIINSIRWAIEKNINNRRTTIGVSSFFGSLVFILAITAIVCIIKKLKAKKALLPQSPDSKPTTIYTPPPIQDDSINTVPPNASSCEKQ